MSLTALLQVLDGWCAALLIPLAVWILVSGLDDALIDLLWLVWARRPVPSQPAGRSLEAPRLTAILVPLWREDGVIGRMVEHNLAAIEYSEYHFFLGAYPNDEPTLEAVRELESEHARVHLAVCPHDGPTSKADCLNWIYQHLLAYEEEHGVRFETLIIHDAEDLIHPRALACINQALGSFDTVQVPVFALPSGVTQLTHGVYADEFAEYQSRDMLVRQRMGSFVPSCGVGTGYRREALERLAQASCNRIFEPSCLTEDYENGLRLHELGCRQGFLPPEAIPGGPVATREYFPVHFRAAVRQRTRWLTGNVLQAWERHGWRGGFVRQYWLWRDRKGLLGSLIAAATNLLTVYAALRAAAGFPMMLDVPGLQPFAVLGGVMLAWRMAMRGWFAYRLYGWPAAAGVPLRMLHGNVVNAAASLCAIGTYVRAKVCREPLRWVKTEHEYPSRAVLRGYKRTLSDIFVLAGYVDANELEAAQLRLGPGEPVEELLLEWGSLSEEDLAEAIALSENLPLVLSPRVDACAASLLPATSLHDWRAVPFQVSGEQLHVAVAHPPDDDLRREFRLGTDLRIRFHITTRSALARAFAGLGGESEAENRTSSGIISSGAFLRSR